MQLDQPGLHPRHRARSSSAAPSPTLSSQTWTAINVRGFIGLDPLTTTAELATRRAPRSTPTSATGSPCPARSTASPRSPRAQTHDVQGQAAAAPRCRCRHRASTGSASTRSATTAKGGSAGGGRARPHVPSAMCRGPRSPTPGTRTRRSSSRSARASTRGPDGAVVDPGASGRSSLRSGPLHDAVATGRRRSGRPLTWLVDPAVPDVVRRLAAGQPGPDARRLPSRPGQGDESPSASPTVLELGQRVRAPRRRSRPPPPPARPSAGSSSSTRCSAPTPARSWACRTATSPSTARPRTTCHCCWRGVPAHRPHPPPVGPAAEHASSPRPTAAPPVPTISRLPHDTTVLLPDTAVQDQTHVINRVERAPADPGLVVGRAGRARSGRPAELAGVAPADPVRGRAPGPRRPAAARGGAADGHDSGRWVPASSPGSTSRGFGSPPSTAPPRGPRPRSTPPACVEPSSDSPQFDPDLYVTAQSDPGERQQARVGAGRERRAAPRSCSTRSPATRRTPRSASRCWRCTGCRASTTGSTRNLDAIDLAAPESVTLASTSGRFSAIVSNELDVPVTVTVRAVSDPQLDDHRRRDRAAAAPRPHHGAAQRDDPRARRPHRDARARPTRPGARSARPTRSRCGPSR